MSKAAREYNLPLQAGKVQGGQDSVIDTVLRLLRKGRSEAEGLEAFTGLLFGSALEHSLEGLDGEKLARFAQDAFASIAKKAHRRHTISARRTDLMAGRDAKPVVSVDILNDDMPYVVESVMAEVQARGLKSLLVLHPIYKVKRYGSGRLMAVVGPGDRNWASGDQESFMAVVIEEPPQDALRDLLAALDGVLDDVRNAATDAEQMKARLVQAIGALEAMPVVLGAHDIGLNAMDVGEAVEFLRWLTRGNFTALGMRDYDFVGTEAKSDLWPSTTAALGVMKSPDLMVLRRGSEQLQITPDIRAFYSSAQPLIITKSSAMSRVRERVHLDYIGIKRYAATGSLVGELRVLGQFTPAAYLQPVEAVPLIRQKVRRVLAQAEYPPDSHNGRTLIDILDGFPRDELFQIDMKHLFTWSLALLDLKLRPRTRVLARRDPFNRYYSVLVFVPRDQYSSAARERIAGYLANTLGGHVAAYYPRISTEPLVRVQFIISIGRNEPRDVPDAVLESDVVALLKSWRDRLEQALASHAPGLAQVYRAAFSAGYAETFEVDRAVEDIARIERLGPDRPVAIDFYHEAEFSPNRVRAAVYRFDTPIPLSERVPLLENMGFRVIDERSYHVRPELAGGAREVVLHDMVLETASGAAIDLSQHDSRMEDCFLAVFHGRAENDLFNALVIAAGLDWHEAAVLRAYAAYLRQIRAPFSPRYVAETLLEHPGIARDLAELFRFRFDPDQLQNAVRRGEAMSEQRLRIEAALGAVQSLEQDRILRRMLNLVLATVRTSFFQADAAGGAAPAPIAFKLDSKAVDAMPEPKPYREIFVTGPRVEGIHLRFSAIARGGIRWSDRPQDFRTEVLGLAKAQQVKNTVIVPSGAKGGFVVKSHKRTATREEAQQEGIACYRLFITALLSLTDNIREGQMLPPARVLRHDGDDPYLVVAADKGTATFSDYANEIALDRGFWLGDAFASGGSAGYDHKKIGITARGAFELIKRHFREMDVDIMRQPIRVAGVGDMSGDVFGNGMMLSPAMLLVAAFDHRDIFIDPTPDAAVALGERKRLFGLPRSSWADYEKALISAGGGVFSRSAKAIPLSPQMRETTGLDGESVTPNELIQAILKSPVDLLFFGGIGTFIRASTETDEQAGDRANDGIRITGDEVRAKVIGEGANLGVTQRGRIEAAARGVRINTDFIDNSAGVNTSDEEVNIKIALAPAVAAGRLALAERNGILAGMAGAVAGSVLANNYAQGLALSLAEQSSARDIHHLSKLARLLEEQGLLVRRIEALPTGAEFQARATEGKGLTRPELAVLLSWAKIALNAELLGSDAPDSPELEPMLLEYFPPEMRMRFADDIRQHRLRREIIATRLTNSMINRGGPALMVKVAEAGAWPVAEVAQAFGAARAIFGLTGLWTALDQLDGHISGALQLKLYGKVQDLLTAETTRLLQTRGARTFAQLVAGYEPAVRVLMEGWPQIAAPMQRERLLEETRRLTAAGVPEALALRLTGLDLGREAIDLKDKANAAGSSVEHTARVMMGCREFLRLDDLAARAVTIKAADAFDTEAIEAALATFHGEAATLTARLIADTNAGAQDIARWIDLNAPKLAEAKPVIDNILAQPETTVSRLTVAAARVRGTAAG